MFTFKHTHTQHPLPAPLVRGFEEHEHIYLGFINVPDDILTGSWRHFPAATNCHKLKIKAARELKNICLPSQLEATMFFLDTNRITSSNRPPEVPQR